MSIQLDNPIPATPSPKDKYAASREEEHLRSTDEIFKKFQALVDLLDQYPPTQIVDALGNVYNALAQQTGAQEISGFDFQTTDESNASDGVRVLVRNGYAPLLASQMTPGQDCYLSVGASGYVIYELDIDETTGSFTGASIYMNATIPAQSAVAVYLPIAYVTVGAGPEITNIGQITSGSKSVTIFSSLDGTVLYGVWN